MQAESTWAPFFRALLSGISDEAYIIDASRMVVQYASEQALKTHQSTLSELQALPLEDLIGATPDMLRQFTESESREPSTADVFRYSIFGRKQDIEQGRAPACQFACIQAGETPWIIAICPSAGIHRSAMQALDESESRFQAIVANTPGLVFQFRKIGEDQLDFIYLSDACNAVLGLNADDLRQSPSLFYTLMNEQDRASFGRALKASANRQKVLNWEGQVWIEAWRDTKWINVRGTPSKMADGVVQWGGIITNITQSKNEKLEIERSHERLAELSAHLTQVKEQERIRIAREIHDDLGGNLTAIKIGLSSIINRIDPEHQGLIERARNLESIVDQTFDAAHRIASDLRPDILELGIVEALEWQSRQFEKQIGLSCSFNSNQPEVAVSSDEGIALYRIAQEAMSNIAKHARAQHVSVILAVSEHDITLEVADDGVGIGAGDEQKPSSFGLRGMLERVGALDGTLDVKRRKPKGTSVTIKIPRTLK